MQGGAAQGFINFLARVLEEHRPTHAVICADLPHPNFRHKLAPDLYKAQRPPKEAALVEQLAWAEELASDVHGVLTLSAQGYEADDVIAAVTKQAVAAGLNVALVALDKDLMQLVEGEQVWMTDGKKSMVRPAQVVEKFGVRPDQLGDYLALVGDVCDNVPGVHGLGPKAAVEILTAYGTLDAALLAALGLRAEGFFKTHQRYRAILRDQAEEARLYQKLIRLADDAPVTLDLAELKR
jgi:DNA polymerase-1